MMKLIDHKIFFRSLAEMLGRNADSFADVVLTKLSQSCNE
jgi:hypothetical protein